MLKKLWARLVREVVTDVPAGLEACMSCGFAHCPADRVKDCAHRQEQAAATKALAGPVTVIQTVPAPSGAREAAVATS